MTIPDGKQRVLFVSDGGDRIAGAERSLLYLIEQLDRSRFECCTALGSDGELASELRRQGVEVAIVPMHAIDRTINPARLCAHLLHFVTGVLRVAWLIRRWRIDVVHSNKNTTIFYSIVPAALMRRKSVWHVRNYVSNFGFIGWLLIRLCDHLLVVSSSVAEPFRRSFRGIEGKLTIVNEGIDAEAYRAQAGTTDIRSELGVAPGAPLVGLVGRITAWKGQAEFIQAAKLVSEVIPAARFLLVGDCIGTSQAEQVADEEYKQSLVRLVEQLEMGDRVFFTGHRTDVPSIMSALDVMVCASWSEPFGMVVTEAMAVGTPVVATRAGGPVDIIRHEMDGLLVEPRSPEELAQAAIRLLADGPLARALAEEAKDRVAACFTLEAYCDRIQGVYGRLAPEPRDG